MYLVLDIGGTYIKYAYMKEEGEICSSGKYPTCAKQLEEFLSDLDPYVHDVKGIAISCPGIIDASQGYIQQVTLLPCLNQFNLKECLEDRYHLPVSVENDAKCACLAEMWRGSLKNVQSGLMMVLGSGIGGAVVLNGELYKGQRQKAGEIGSLLCKTDEGYQSFGARCSAVRMVRKIAAACNLDTEDGEKVFELIQAHQPVAWEIFEAYCEEIALQMYTMDYLLDLDVVAIGGGISCQPLVLETIQHKFSDLRFKYREDNHDPELRACTFHNDANLWGALAHFKNK